MAFGVTLIHAQQIHREQRGLVAARTRPHLQNGAFLVRRVARKQHNAELSLDLGNASGQLAKLFFRERLHVIVAVGIRHQRGKVARLALGRPQFLNAGHDGRQLGEFLGHPHEVHGVRAIRHQRRQVAMAFQNPIETLVEAHASPPPRRPPIQEIRSKAGSADPAVLVTSGPRRRPVRPGAGREQKANHGTRAAFRRTPVNSDMEASMLIDKTPVVQRRRLRCAASSAAVRSVLRESLRLSADKPARVAQAGEQ